MVPHRMGLVGVGVLLAGVLPAAGAAPPQAASPGKAPDQDAYVLALKIDQYLAERWKAEGVKPAPLADDAAFLRRVYLDITGKIPPAAEVRRFLRDPAPDKRQRVVEQLLDGPGYVGHFSTVFRHLLVPEADTNLQVRFASFGFESWLHKKLGDGAGYDQIARELIVQPVGNNPQGLVDFYGQGGQASPLPFYLAKEAKPENLAASTARIFLGVRVECAQCHDHPFAKWKREQFWGEAAFFAGIQGRSQDGFLQNVRELADRREMAVPGTDRVAQATFLDGTEPQWKYKVGARETLAQWMTAPENPFFARTAANRLWAHFFGTGIVEPVDDFKEENPPSHPELLDELARQFAAHHFDLKFLIRALAASEAYQLSSVTTDPVQEDPRLFARMAVKGLTPEQIFDSFSQATGFRDPTPLRQQVFAIGTPRNDFMSKFTQQDRLTELQVSIPQALALMNSQLVTNATSVERSENLAAVIDAPFMDTNGRIEALFLSTLSRKPTPEELARLAPYVNGGGPKHDSKRALADVFWALLNSAEFVLNH
jgi:hypothetical protein